MSEETMKYEIIDAPMYGEVELVDGTNETFQIGVYGYHVLREDGQVLSTSNIPILFTNKEVAQRYIDNVCNN